MESCPTKLTIKVKREHNDVSGSTFPAPLDSRKKEQQTDPNDSTSPCHLESKKREQNDFNSSTLHESTPQKPGDTTSEEDDYPGSEDEDNQSYENAQNQLVLYDPAANGAGEIVAVDDPIQYQPPPPRRAFQTTNVLPSVGAFTVQCAKCFKWRFIPTKEKYEEIREHLLEHPFVCEVAREWRPEISCDDKADIVQDGSRIWAIDRPNIAQPPPGWQRLLRIRGVGCSKFADVYYVAPSGKRLRSMVEIERYLLEHPEYADGVSKLKFSFQIPRPLQRPSTKKSSARSASDDGSDLGLPGSLEPSEADPIACAYPDGNFELRLGGPGFSAPRFVPPEFEPLNQPAKKPRKTQTKKNCNGEYNSKTWPRQS